jgi:parallel beta-helix repeat protein
MKQEEKMQNLKKVLGTVSVVSLVSIIALINSCGTTDPEENNEPPVISINGDNPDTIRVGDHFIDGGWSASDPEDGDLTSSVTVNYGAFDTASAAVGTYTITYSVTDSDAETVTAQRIVVVLDNSVKITNASLASCPVTFADTLVIYSIPSNLTLPAGCTVTFGKKTKVYVNGIIYVGNGASLIIQEGAHFYFDDNRYISVGESGSGTIKALGSATDSIHFLNLVAGTKWGYGSSATSSGGIWIDDGATAACSLDYCIIDSATTGIHVEKAAVTVTHCRVSNNQFFGVYFADNGMPSDSASFINNVITSNGTYGIGIYADFVGRLSGTGSVAGNTSGGINIVSDEVETDAVWKKHDASYVVTGKIGIGSSAGATVTVRPGCRFELKDNAYISVGASEEGTLIAEGTSTDSIVFTNSTSGTTWGYGSTATNSGGIWIDDFSTDNTSLKYCVIENATSGVHVEDAAVSISNCRISGNDFYGICFADGGQPIDSASFVDNSITDNGECGISIYANYVGYLSGTGTFINNTNGGILIQSDVVESDAVWKKHDAEYVVSGTQDIGAPSGVTVTIRPGAQFKLKDNAYISVGESEEGTLIAEGTPDDSIVFTNYSTGTKWGYGSTATNSGGIWVDDFSTDNTSLKYCVIENATSGVYVADAAVSISHCRISGNDFYGIYFADGGQPKDSASFVENTVTANAEYGVCIYGNFVGNLSGTGSFTGNTNGGILIKEDGITNDAIWKKHDAAYVVSGTMDIGAAGGATVTIRPGVRLELQDNAYFGVGESEEATLIAEGTATDSIIFTNFSSGTVWGYGSTATNSGGLWLDDFSTDNTSLKYCLISKATSGIHARDCNPTVKNCHISDCQFYGIYLVDVIGTNIADNTFANNQIDTGTN